jgi:hydroxyethylthiazole kinase-like uncharacterized protein yjeF
MPRAGLAAARFVQARLLAPGPVLALVGPGNNGGDALVVATHLREWGYDVTAVMPAGADKMPDDARQAYAAWHAAGGAEQAALPARPPALVVDGLFGIGLDRPLGETWQELVDAVNAWHVPILALDVPSGLQAETGRALGRPIRATWTLSFIAAAWGLALADGPAYCGERHVDALGLEPELFAQALG